MDVYCPICPIDNTVKGGLTIFWELLLCFLGRQNISNVNNIVICRHLDLKLKLMALKRKKKLSL